MRYQVSLYGNPPLEIEVENPPELEDADGQVELTNRLIQIYCRERGIIASEHAFRVIELRRPAEPSQPQQPPEKSKKSKKKPKKKAKPADEHCLRTVDDPAECDPGGAGSSQYDEAGRSA